MTTQNILLIVAIILIVLAILALVGQRVRRSRELRERFGPEYDRAVESRGGRLKAESDLDERERRHQELDIRPLEPEERERYAREWARVQERFVDEPATAATQADRLVTALMNDRGYPTETYETRTETLSVEHADTLQHYRVAHDIVARTGGDGGPDGGLGGRLDAGSGVEPGAERGAGAGAGAEPAAAPGAGPGAGPHGHRGGTSTESLRQAMTHYRELFDELLEPVHAGHRTSRGHDPGPGRPG